MDITNKIDQFLKEAKSISSFESHAAWLRTMGKKLEKLFGEDDEKWNAWEDAMLDRGWTKKDIDTLQHNWYSSADRLHYNSNGKTDGGHIKALLDNWADLKRDVEATAKKWR